MDFIGALVLLLCFSPIIIFVAMLVKLNIGSPIFYKQKRPGLNSNIFELVKFRTMKEGVDDLGKLLPDSQRMTNFGSWLRSTSLDELPSLLNVLKGDVSLIGPRPLLVEYLPLYNKEQIKRHKMRPGVTGWAQVNGRNAISWEQKFKLDIWYVENHSFWLDIKILFLTVKKVFLKEGISGDGEVTMHKFTGNK